MKINPPKRALQVLHWFYGMYKSYLKIGWRNFLRNKGYSFINIGGLALGITVAMLTGLWMHDELPFDSYHPNHDRIAQVMRHKLFQWQDPDEVAIRLPWQRSYAMLTAVISKMLYTPAELIPLA